ncbi:RNA-directed DNA polymerase, eukaryota, partial [Tanacetum coccineum]
MGATDHRNSFRSFEDHTQEISHSVYVTNFPDSVNSRDLWNSCSAYGTVIDVFIPVKKSKAGKRFAFVRLIKVNNLVRLVENLCTIWIGRHHLFANQVRYERPQKPYSPPNVKSGANIRPPGVSGLHQSNVRTGSYANIVNDAPIAKNKNSSFPVFDLPALILNETCANDGHLSRHVMIELNNVETKNDLLHHTGVKSWFHELQDGTFDFVSNERIVWVDIEGIPLSVWSHATFSKIGKTFMVRAKELFTWTPCFLEYKESEYASDDELPRGMNNKSAQSAQEDDILVEDTDDEGVADTYFGDNSSPPISNGRNANDQEATQHSKDPFGFYNLLKNPPASTVLESDPSLTHPPGYTPEPSQQEIHNDASVHERGNRFESPIQKESPPLVPNTAKDPSVGQSMGYDMEGCSNDIERIISLQGVDETKMECISYMDVKFIWGNSNFQFISSDSIGNSGGILCVWDQSIFKKDGATVSDNFIALLELTRKLYELKQLDRKDVAQKAKVQWAIEGDESSKYFHCIINKRRAQLGIQGVFPMYAHLKLNMMFPNQLTPDQVEDLYRNIANDEIKAVYWDIIGSDFYVAVDWFFVSGTLPRGCNSSFIALIPKVTDAKFVTDFRPISLIGSVYKVITKILANRLSTVISDLGHTILLGGTSFLTFFRRMVLVRDGARG